MRNYNSYHEEEKGIPANVPAPHYEPEDRIELVRQPSRPVSTRAAVEGVNVPLPGESFEHLNLWRQSMGLGPVTGR